MGKLFSLAKPDGLGRAAQPCLSRSGCHHSRHLLVYRANRNSSTVQETAKSDVQALERRLQQWSVQVDEDTADVLFDLERRRGNAWEGFPVYEADTTEPPPAQGSTPLSLQQWLDGPVRCIRHSGARVLPHILTDALEQLCYMQPSEVAADATRIADELRHLLVIACETPALPRAKLLNLLGDVAQVHCSTLAKLVVGPDAECAPDVGCLFSAAAVDYGSYSNSYNASQMATAQVKLQFLCPQWWTGHMRESLAYLSPRAISTIIQRAVVVTLPPMSAPPLPPSIWKRLLVAVTCTAPNMDAQGVTNCMWACARACRNRWGAVFISTDLQACVSTLTSAAAKLSPSMKPQGIATCLWAAAVLTSHTQVATRDLRELVCAAAACAPRMGLRDAIMCTLALRWLKVQLTSTPGMCLVAVLLRYHNRICGADAASLLWCLSATCAEELPREFMILRQRLLARAVMEEHSLRPQDVSVMLWALHLTEPSWLSAQHLVASRIFTTILAATTNAAFHMDTVQAISSLVALCCILSKPATATLSLQEAGTLNEALSTLADRVVTGAERVGASDARSPAMDRITGLIGQNDGSLDSGLLATALWAFARLAVCDSKKSMQWRPADKAREPMLHALAFLVVGMAPRELGRSLWGVMLLEWPLNLEIAATLQDAVGRLLVTRSNEMEVQDVHQMLCASWQLGLQISDAAMEQLLLRVLHLVQERKISVPALADICAALSELGAEGEAVLREEVELAVAEVGGSMHDRAVCMQFVRGLPQRLGSVCMLHRARAAMITLKSKGG